MYHRYLKIIRAQFIRTNNPQTLSKQHFPINLLSKKNKTIFLTSFSTSLLLFLTNKLNLSKKFNLKMRNQVIVMIKRKQM